MTSATKKKEKNCYCKLNKEGQTKTIEKKIERKRKMEKTKSRGENIEEKQGKKEGRN